MVFSGGQSFTGARVVMTGETEFIRYEFLQELRKRSRDCNTGCSGTSVFGHCALATRAAFPENLSNVVIGSHDDVVSMQPFVGDESVVTS